MSRHLMSYVTSSHVMSRVHGLGVGFAAWQCPGIRDVLGGECSVFSLV